MLGRYYSLSWYAEITSSTKRFPYDKNLLLTCQNLGTLLYHVYWQISISQTFFEKGHSRNIPVKLFQNLTSSFREDFIGIWSWSNSESSPHSPEPCLWMDQNFANKFWERSLMEDFCELRIRSHLLCCAYRLDIATELTG